MCANGEVGQDLCIDLIAKRRLDFFPVISTPFDGAYCCDGRFIQIGCGMVKIFGVDLVGFVGSRITFVIRHSCDRLMSEPCDLLDQTVISCFDCRQMYGRTVTADDDRRFVRIFFFIEQFQTIAVIIKAVKCCKPCITTVDCIIIVCASDTDKAVKTVVGDLFDLGTAIVVTA